MHDKKFVMKVLRLAITGQEHGMPLFEAMAWLGKEKCLKRMRICLNKLEYIEMCQLAIKARYYYYVRGNSIISDRDYDFLEKQIESIEKENPEWVNSNSPTQCVGSDRQEDYDKNIYFIK